MATGEIIWHDGDGAPQSIKNPTDGHCYGVRPATGEIMNNTNRDAILHTASSCSGQGFSVPAGVTTGCLAVTL